MNFKQLMNPIFIFWNLWRQRELIVQLTKRDIIGRYKGSCFGILWSFITPIFMLIVYTFVFSVVFKAKWGVGSDSKVEFAMVLFCGLNAYNIFSECINRAPGLILNNANFVKKVVFPLEILPIVVIGSALINGCIGFLVLMAGVVFFMGILNWTVLFLPLVLLPLLLLTLGLSWFLASLGVFLRDIGQVVTVLISALLFASPIFYPITAIPEELQKLFYLNPISYIVQDLRRIFIWGQMPDWDWLLAGITIGIFVTALGHAWFQKTRGGFADVL
ncbi:ABC transporter permease [Pelotomaculum terephthalicicum JT]|uniref:ABC transporter permease n=1 Tax=Pelotomaculum terephthalicicum TaxID=206393 RepID=UPI001F03C836|nr:ABC transporter permease [Pelotomaculum terephthalicicum]MCG9966645.1 ABC transporter permease [Pelotomaculum terephthalicicum JT]